MDVPFATSGASSRAHYVLVRKLEEETSFIRADQHLADAVEATLRDLSNSQLSLKQRKEHLITLLYCYTTASAGALERGALNSALPHAVTLAEAGRTVAEKRIGYLFCSEVMPAGHDLQLMLVNTLRKDLESSHVPRICLALDHLNTSPSEEVIPAIQTRLFDLLAHSSPPVRRRTLLAYKQLSRYRPDLLVSVVPNVCRRLKDSDSSVSNAALPLITRAFLHDESSRPDIYRVVNDLSVSILSGKRHEEQRRFGSSGIKILNALMTVGLSDDNLTIIGHTIRSSVKRKDYALLLEAFRLLGKLGPTTPLLESRKLSPIVYVRDLLTSRSINDQYLFLLCLESVDPKYWAGTTQEIPSVLDQWEVEHVVRLLDSKDPLVRKMTVRVLNQVDDNVVESYYSRSLQQIPSDLSIDHKAEYVCRLLEILEIEAQGDGERYAREVQDILQHVYTVTSENKEAVLEPAVQSVLSFIRTATADWQIQCATTFLARFLELRQSDPTVTVILAALACEYIGRVSLPPHELLQSLSSQLATCTPPVQEACLLAILRVAAECDHIPQDVSNVVSKVGEAGGRRIRLFSSKFLELAEDRASLETVVRGAKSSALPDFLQSLLSFKQAPGASSSSQGHTQPQSPSQQSGRLPSSKLRYAAYERPPPATPRSKGRSLSRSSGHTSPRRSPIFNVKTLTGGDLAIAASTENFEMSLMKSGLPQLDTSSTGATVTTSETGKTDLIALDSPFISDPRAKQNNDIEQLWNGLDQSNSSRGWYEGPIREVVARVKNVSDMGAEVIDASIPPFEGEVKIILTAKDQEPCGILRLKASEEDSCLWRLRGKGLVCEKVKDLLTHV
ncbi:hypothetical protein PM082_001421 [Marasmius tenuissimus]|nr:hypothetical protein PM082_001421 [Marasmius tenuissimus]